MISTLATTRPSAATIVQPGSAVISRQASPRSTSRKKSHRNAPVAAVPIPMRTRFRRHLGIWQVSMSAGVRRRTRQAGRFSGKREVAIGLGVYALYLLASRRKRGDAGRLQAAKNAERVVALERRLKIHVEPKLQELLLPHRRLLGVLNVAYVVSNAALTVGWLMRLYARRHPEFHRFRRAAVITTLACQPIFYFFPCAPPRSLDHFVDTIADVSGFDLDSGAVAQLYDPLAAMPSIHVAYAVVTAAGIEGASESGVLRALAPAYPPLVAAVVFVTANHYVLDAVAGAAVAGVALRLAR
jgi:hypothetical protein